MTLLELAIKEEWHLLPWSPRCRKRGAYVLSEIPAAIAHLMPDGPTAQRYRIVATAKVGRALLPGEHVHHQDRNKRNDHPDNLEVLTAAEHRQRHRGDVHDDSVSGLVALAKLRAIKDGRPEAWREFYDPDPGSLCLPGMVMPAKSIHGSRSPGEEK